MLPPIAADTVTAPTAIAAVASTGTDTGAVDGYDREDYIMQDPADVINTQLVPSLIMQII